MRSSSLCVCVFVCMEGGALTEEYNSALCLHSAT